MSISDVIRLSPTLAKFLFKVNDWLNAGWVGILYLLLKILQASVQDDVYDMLAKNEDDTNDCLQNIGHLIWQYRQLISVQYQLINQDQVTV